MTASTSFARPVVEFRHWDVSSLACASLLADKDIPVRLPCLSHIETGLAFVSSEVLALLDLVNTDVGHPLAVAGSYRLTEDDAVAEAHQDLRGKVMNRQALGDALVARLGRSDYHRDAIESHVVVDSNTAILRRSRSPSGHGAMFPAMQQSLNLNWSTPGGTAEPLWIRYSGETLSDIDSSASILRDGDQISLILHAPMRSIIEQSIALIDVLARFLAHPAVRAQLPDRPADTAGVRLQSSKPISPVGAGHPARIRIGDAAGQSDPVSLDPELASAINAAAELAKAAIASDLTLARLSRIWRQSSSLWLTN